MSDQGLPCCEAGRTCAEIAWIDGHDMDPPQSRDGFTIIVDLRPDSPQGYDFIRGAIAYCPFCGTKIEGAS